MTTSLSQQLRKLAVPQTSILVDSKTRPSILFEPKEAATKDRQTIYDLGTEGLAELIALNPAFAQFEDTLFQHTSLNVERSVEDAAFNKELDKNIKKFFHHLSPYFMLRSAHLCLEWLIRRFQVNNYNKDAFVALILPYHETNIFVKCVQTMRIQDPNDPWNWLQPLKKPGVPLPKSAIHNRAASEPSFLEFICKSVIAATKELGNRAPTLQCLINFYCSSVIGAFETRNRIQEWHVTTILPALTKGMSSGIVDFVSASYMIATQLVNKAHLTEKLLNRLITDIWKVKCEALQSTSIMLLNWILKTHADIITRLPEQGFMDFIKNKWLNNTINTLGREGISMLYLVVPLIGTAFHILQNDKANADDCKRYIEWFLHEVQFSSHGAKLVIKTILTGLVLKAPKPVKEIKDGDVIDLESDDDDEETCPQASLITWFTNIIQILERQYPSEMDVVIKEAMEDGTSEHSAIKIALGLRYKFLNSTTSSMFENVYHANPSVRAMSVKEIIAQINNSSDDTHHFKLLKEILADRINDDNEKVVEEILTLPTSVCIEILGVSTFVENIVNILHKAKLNPAGWAYLQTAALTHLTSNEVVTNFDTNIILLAVTRYLVPTKMTKEKASYIKLILQSPLAEKKPFFRTLLEKYKNDQSVSGFKKDFLAVLSQSSDTPHADDLVESLLKNGESSLKTPIEMSHFLIMVTACFKTNNNLETAYRIYDFTVKRCLQFKIALPDKEKKKNKKRSKFVPLQLFVDFLDGVVRGTHFENINDWRSSSKSCELFLSIFHLLTSKAFSAKLDTKEKEQWTKSLRNVFNLLFATTKQKLNFLSQFLVYENFTGLENYPETRIRGLKLMEAVLRAGNVDADDIDLHFILKAIVALSSPSATVRECSLDILRAAKPFNKKLSSFIGQLIERSEEIQFDAEQIPLILFTILSSKKRKTTDSSSLIGNILTIMEDPMISLEFKSKVFGLLKHIKSANILNSIIPIALSSLENVQTDGNLNVLDLATANVFSSVIARLDENCIREVIATNKHAWQLIERSFKHSKAFINIDGKLCPVPCVCLQFLEENIYSQLPAEYKIKLLKLIIETIAQSENDVFFLDVNKALKKCNLDCKHVLPLLEAMNTINQLNGDTLNKKKSLVRPTLPNDVSLLSSNQWKEGVVLLEILENKKKLQNTHLLIPILFDILKRCLDMESQSPFEYTKQLILSALLQCCQKSSEDNQLMSDVSARTFKIDLIVQCIRVTQNPQTHYNALLFLSHCAVLFPQQVMHNLVDIFTFMGSSITRHDDAFSFQIISNIVESIIPILVADYGSSADENNAKRVVPVLKIFSDIILDVPEHRRRPLYIKLLSTLGAEKYFWQFLCVVFESHVIKEEKNRSSGSKSASAASTDDKLPKRIDICLKLLNEFSTAVSIQTCISLLDYVKRLPMDKDEQASSTGMLQSQLNDSQDNELFNVKTRSSKQLRHYKYLILQYVSTLTSSMDFLKAISVLDEEQNRLNKALYQKLIIKILSFIPDVTLAIEKSTDSTHGKFWKVILHHCYDALDNVISLLSPDIFLIVVHGLMQHKVVTIRKKVLELLVSKLQQNSDYFNECMDENVLNLLNSLGELIGTITAKDRNNSNETIFVQQAGLIAIKLFSKQFAFKHMEQFKTIVEHLTNITKKRANLSKVIIATVVLTLVEIMSNLKAHGIAHLPKFMPHLVEALKDQSSILQKQSPDNVCLALLTGIQKLFEAMPLFLGPYIQGVVSALSTMWFRIKNGPGEQEQKKSLIINKLETIWKKMASEVPARVLIPNCEKAFYALVLDEQYSGIKFLMKLFFECVSRASDSDLSSLQSELTKFFLKCLEFRANMANADVSSEDEINSTEMEIINAFVAWILKLSESSFRPIYKRLHSWAYDKRGPKPTEKVLTYFILNRCISDSLKSLFVLFSWDFVKDAAKILDDCNVAKRSSLFFPHSYKLNADLVKNILLNLSNIFLYDTKGFSNSHRFDTLMKPLVDQLDNKLVLDSEELQGILLLCIGQLAVAVSNDVLWKQLHYQILLKTRSNVPEVRIISFNCCVELARKLGDDFTCLLPETVPFVAELFEDENPLVVKNSRKAVQELETILGESLQKYL